MNATLSRTSPSRALPRLASAALAATLGLGVSGFTPTSATTAATGGPARPVLATGAVQLRNMTWTQVAVEVRLGASTDCELNSESYVRTLRLGKRWEVVAESGTSVCWRRESSPGSQNGSWTTWTRRVIANEQTTEQVL